MAVPKRKKQLHYKTHQREITIQKFFTKHKIQVEALNIAKNNCKIL